MDPTGRVLSHSHTLVIGLRYRARHGAVPQILWAKTATDFRDPTSKKEWGKEEREKQNWEE